LLFFPVTAELGFVAQATLVFCQLYGVLAEGIDRLKHRAIRERSKQRNACIKTNNRRRRMHQLRDLALGLNAGVPLTSNTGHGDILDCAFDSAALAIVYPAQLGL